MPHYMFQVAYTSESWATQIKNPQNRMEAIRPVVESVGGKLESFHLAFGEYDVIIIAEFPDNVSAGAISVAAAAGGGVKAIKTTPLMTVEEGMEMARKAAGSGYRPPGS
ncbi:MAG: GYD domain-containing protein [Chloroflexi bacterium]|nr:GYD domain-containing protein [Chloroflexota bacterium]MCH8226078.1 GYD domain-containing protein [Chloroflexota bacterium]MCI0846679.1 GYD domain-containing protein [Chloroflexota bacterium]